MNKPPTTFIYVSLQVEGVHCWTDIPDIPELAEVQYLRNPHRHIFHIKAQRLVEHDDRQIEIIMFKQTILAWLNKEFKKPGYGFLYFGTMSCEQIAKAIMTQFSLTSCTVLEDGENGAIVVDL